MSLRQLGSVFRTGPAAGPCHLVLLSNYLGAGIALGRFSGSKVILEAFPRKAGESGNRSGSLQKAGNKVAAVESQLSMSNPAVSSET